MKGLQKWSTIWLAPLLFESSFARPTQQPLVSPSHASIRAANYTNFELRRYGISSREDLVHMVNLVNQANIDVWHLTPSHVDVHMDTTADLPESLAHRRYTTLPHSFPYNYNYTSIPLNRLNIDLSSLEDNEFHRAYHTYEEIDQFVVALASQYPKLVEVVWLGASWEKRDVFALRIGRRGRGNHKKGNKRKKHNHLWTDNPAQESEPLIAPLYHYVKSLIRGLAESSGLVTPRKPITIRDLYSPSASHEITQSHPIKNRIVIQGAQHAREASTATALYLAHALVAPNNETGSLRHLLDDFDFTIIPVPNPDGYEYTWTTDRLWYKNRMEFESEAPKFADCKGVDMNRNWGYQWNSSGDGLSDPEDPCSHWYPGAYPFQAPEVIAIANYIRRTPEIRAFLDLRSYGQMLMYPYSYTCGSVPPHAEDIIEAALGATKALREKHGMHYTSGASCELLYPAPGNIIDWMYADANVIFSYSLMLRDAGTYGFLLPPRQIQPVGEETAAAVKYLAKFIEDVSSCLAPAHGC
ncbi:Peptidase M14, carboxypeptidase A domain containing protein [Ceratobasidium theobromae]|uniref:Peptidase M14, carboxypeptidase A domain containing protein n=1 Tax=Ceratobasidium theobromae TaxID=1582974 RepID=A0A5N5QRV4_9AGAM|nr:Peptidase M14, carboxypeptidase A domain containing protein [Ceratobasidium theobromae]